MPARTTAVVKMSGRSSDLCLGVVVNAVANPMKTMASTIRATVMRTVLEVPSLRKSTSQPLLLAVSRILKTVLSSSALGMPSPNQNRFLAVWSCRAIRVMYTTATAVMTGLDSCHIELLSRR